MDTQRSVDGGYRGALPADRRIIVVCDEGYASSLAASIRDLGLLDTTDLEGGFQAWRRYVDREHLLPGGGRDKTVAAADERGRGNGR